MDFSLPVLLREIRETASPSFIDSLLYLSIALRGVNELAHSETVLFYAIKTCKDLNVPLRPHARHIILNIDNLCLAISEVGQTERALLWWDIAHTVLMETYEGIPPTYLAVKLCHNSLRCCNQSGLGQQINSVALCWVQRTLAFEFSLEIFHFDRVLIQEALRHAYQLLKQCGQEKCSAQKLLEEKLADYFAKYHKISTACKTFMSPEPSSSKESNSNKTEHDLLLLRKGLLRFCRAVASSNVVPSSAEGISLMVDAFYAKYARHRSIESFLAQIMSSKTQQFLFHEFLAASGDDGEDVDTTMLPEDINTVTAAGTLGVLSQILHRRGKETCASALDTFIDRSQRKQ